MDTIILSMDDDDGMVFIPLFENVRRYREQVQILSRSGIYPTSPNSR